MAYPEGSRYETWPKDQNQGSERPSPEWARASAPRSEPGSAESARQSAPKSEPGSAESAGASAQEVQEWGNQIICQLMRNIP